jgi:hypothetical protein
MKLSENHHQRKKEFPIFQGRPHRRFFLQPQRRPQLGKKIPEDYNLKTTLTTLSYKEKLNNPPVSLVTPQIDKGNTINVSVSLDISWFFAKYVEVLTKEKRMLRKKSSLR